MCRFTNAPGVCWISHFNGQALGTRLRPVRIDLALYKHSSDASSDLELATVDFMQVSPFDYWKARSGNPRIHPLVKPLPRPGLDASIVDSAVIFARGGSGLETIEDLRGRSLLLGTSGSSLTFGAKICLVRAGITARELSKIRYSDSPQEISYQDGKRSASAGPDPGNPFSEMTPIEAVMSGLYDASIVSEQRFRQVEAGERLIVLARFHRPPDILVSSGRAPAKVAVQVQAALTKLADPAILQMYPGNPGGFGICTEDDLLELRDALAMEKLFDNSAAEL